LANIPSLVEQNADGSYTPKSNAVPNIGGTDDNVLASKILVELRIMNIYLQQMTQLLMGLNAATPGVLPKADDAFNIRQDPTFLST
jgi:hypothetical protein